MKRNYIILSIAIVLFWIGTDQALKIWVKTHMHLYEVIPVFGNWFRLFFVENEGMAYGVELGGNYGKLFLSVFRIFAVGFIIYWWYKQLKKKSPLLEILGIASIFAGAVGNIIDSIFYGKYFESSGLPDASIGYTGVADYLPKGNGNGNYLYGKVVDMLHLPIIQSRYPDWFPFWGGEEFVFFQPIFNIADAAISFGVAFLIISQLFLVKKTEENSDDSSGQIEEEEVETVEAAISKPKSKLEELANKAREEMDRQKNENQ